jgi:Ca-activated chloride channel family protein
MARTLIDGSFRPRGAAILLILALTSAAPFAQTPGRPQFSSGVTQVEVYATVTGKDGRPVPGLTAADFTVLEDGQRQTITTFAGAELPAAVALAIDRSVSMKGTPLTMARTAGRVFLSSLGPDDRAMLISISGEVEVLAPLSADRQPALDALARLDPWSTTSLHDAVMRTLDLLDREAGRRAVVILSDGVDRYSQATEAEVLDRARRSDVQIYAIALGATRPRWFVELATVTGGRSFHLDDTRDLGTTLQMIAADLRAQYLLGYAPPAPSSAEDSGWRSISVSVNRPDVTVRARSGYSVR